MAESDYITTQSGLKYFDNIVGEGTRADSSLAVEIHYILWLENGDFINSSYLVNSPLTLIIGDGAVIPGWEEGLVGMQVGGYRHLKIPPNLAYGVEGALTIGVPANATLILEMILLAVGVPIP